MWVGGGACGMYVGGLVREVDPVSRSSVERQ